MNQITHELLIEAGYRRHDRQSARQWLNNADALYQKAIWVGNDLAFYIDVWWYDFRPYRVESPDGWQPEVQFNGHGENTPDTPTFSVTLHPSGMCVLEVEDYFLRIYRALGCNPYEAGRYAPAATGTTGEGR